MREIFLTGKNIPQEEWKKLINKISTYNKPLKLWKIILEINNNKVYYYLDTKCSLPPSINGLSSFLLKKTTKSFPKARIKKLLFIKNEYNAIDIRNYLKCRKKESLKRIEISILKIKNNKLFTSIRVFTKYNAYLLINHNVENILSINFSTNYNLTYQKTPNYLDISKSIHLLKSNYSNSIFQVDAFPYLQGTYYLDQTAVNFNKHSIIFGSSGCGKSMLINLLINNIKKNNLNSQYKIVLIDPHSSIEKNININKKNISFKSKEDSINLFSNSKDDKIISVELLLDIFKGLIPNNYNSKLERVLRHSLFLLLHTNEFNFTNLKNLLLDTEYRHNLVKKDEQTLPMSIIEFFLSEYNDIKTKSYTEAISPIISFIDEMDLLPVFNNNQVDIDLEKTIKENFLTIFSLDRTKLGDKVTKTISGLVMQQLLTLIQKYTFKEHIIFIVDEVAIIENPILNRFLSEARKYNLSLILAGQYFGGISENLRKAIFANAINYYIFRLSQMDANLLVDNINMKIPLNDTKEEKIKLLTELQDRECILRINASDCLLPAIKCKTIDYK